VTIYPNLGALYLAGLVKADLIASELRLYKAIAAPLSVSTILADLTEADFDGYAAATIAAWNAAYLDPQGGASIQCGTQQFDFVPGLGTVNTILGFYVVTAGGDLLFVGEFEAPIPMNALGDSIPVNVTLNYGAPPI